MWDFRKLKAFGEAVGFLKQIESKPRGSVSKAMQGPAFDKTATQMSLYVDFVK